MPTPPVSEDVFTDAFFADPHAVYARLRERGPVHHVETPNRQRVFLVIGHDEARAALSDPLLSKDRAVAEKVYRRHTDPSVQDRDFAQSLSAHMLNTDPPEHTRLRRLVGTAFGPRTVERLRARVGEAAERAVDDLVRRLASDGRADLMAVVANPVPTTVIGELLGIPERDRPGLQDAVTDLLSIGDTGRIDRASQTLAGLLVRTLEARRADPGDDLLTGLMTATDGTDRLEGAELVSMAMLLLIAGYETTVNVIGNGVRALLDHPAEADALRAAPDRIPAAVEELLRHDGPTNTATFRFTAAPVELGGVDLPEGHPVVVSPLAANRDPARWPDPDVLRLDRDATGHLAFGHGVHHCLGAPLGRLEAGIVLDVLLRRVPDLRRAGEVRYRRSMLVRGPEVLPVASGQ